MVYHMNISCPVAQFVLTNVHQGSIQEVVQFSQTDGRLVAIASQKALLDGTELLRVSPQHLLALMQLRA